MVALFGAIFLALPACSVGDVAVHVTAYPQQPVLDFMLGTSDWSFAYNPAYLPGSETAPEGLLVRVQNNSEAQPVECANNSPPTTSSYLAYASISADPAVVNHLDGMDAILFGPSLTPWEQTAEDPRIVLHEGIYYTTYTANGNETGPPLNRHQGIAATKTPLDPSSWKRMCDAEAPCLQDGLKSGAMLPRASPPHYMLTYDLRDGVREIVMAISDDLVHWNLTGQTLIGRRNGTWDAGLTEPGPPPVRLSNGNYLALYNSARQHGDREYHTGFVILDGDDPTKVLQRSDEPLLSWNDTPWMIGNSTDYLCNVPQVVFTAAARPLGNDAFQLYFGGADASVGTATISVSLEQTLV